MALTRITLLLAEDHAYGIFTGWQAECPTPTGRMSGSSSGGGHCSPCRVAAGESTEPANVSDSTAHTLGVNLPRLRLISIC